MTEHPRGACAAVQHVAVAGGRGAVLGDHVRGVVGHGAGHHRHAARALPARLLQEAW